MVDLSIVIKMVEFSVAKWLTRSQYRKMVDLSTVTKKG
jgi:hypothetical protein